MRAMGDSAMSGAVVARVARIAPAPLHRLPVLVTAAGEQANMRFIEFFAFAIRNPHTRQAVLLRP